MAKKAYFRIQDVSAQPVESGLGDDKSKEAIKIGSEAAASAIPAGEAATAVAAEPAQPPESGAAVQTDAETKRDKSGNTLGTGSSTFASLAASTAPFAAVNTSKSAFGFGSLANGGANNGTEGSTAGKQLDFHIYRIALLIV